MRTPCILSIEASDAIRPKLNCFISMLISVAKLSGFPPLHVHCMCFLYFARTAIAVRIDLNVDAGGCLQYMSCQLFLFVILCTQIWTPQ